MPASGGLASTATIMFGSCVAGAVLSPVTAWLANLTPGMGALLGTIIVGIFAAVLREAMVQLRWYYDRKVRNDSLRSRGTDLPSAE